MKNDRHTFFPITISYKGIEIATKALKYAYTSHETLYKVVLSSAVSAINQCWLSKVDSGWKFVMGGEIDPALSLSVISAIENYESVPAMYAVQASGLKSA